MKGCMKDLLFCFGHKNLTPTFMTEISLLITGILFDDDMDKSFAIKIAKQIKKDFINEDQPHR